MIYRFIILPYLIFVNDEINYVSTLITSNLLLSVMNYKLKYCTYENTIQINNHI